MKVLSYIKDNNKQLPFELGDELGYGADGQVFSLKTDISRVIKLSIIYQDDKSLIQEFDEVKEKFNYLINRNIKHLAKVFEFKFLLAGARKTINGDQNYILYYTVLEKLNKISEDESKVLKTLCDSYNKKFEINKSVIQIINELQNWLSFDKEKVLEFYWFLTNCPVKHNDVHRRNIMKDDYGNFKLIDFDRMTMV